MLERVAHAALVVGFAILLVVGVVTGDRGRPSASASDPAVALVEAWARYRSATFYAAGTWSRESGDARLETASLSVQRPPDRLFVQSGSVAALQDGFVVSCIPGDIPRDTGAGNCRQIGDPIDFDQLVVDEVAQFARLVEGPEPLYLVSFASTGCFSMSRTRFDPAAARYGSVAEVCFDRRTGALASLDAVHDNGVTETTRYDEIRPNVTDEDLALTPQ